MTKRKERRHISHPCDTFPEVNNSKHQNGCQYCHDYSKALKLHGGLRMDQWTNHILETQLN